MTGVIFYMLQFVFYLRALWKGKGEKRRSRHENREGTVFSRQGAELTSGSLCITTGMRCRQAQQESTACAMCLPGRMHTLMLHQELLYCGEDGAEQQVYGSTWLGWLRSACRISPGNLPAAAAAAHPDTQPTAEVMLLSG